MLADANMLAVDVSPASLEEDKFGIDPGIDRLVTRVKRVRVLFSLLYIYIYIYIYKERERERIKTLFLLPYIFHAQGMLAIIEFTLWSLHSFCVD